MRYLPFLLLVLLLFVPVLPGAAQVAQPATCVEQLVNGSFEDDTVGWQISSAGGYALLSQALPHTGQWGAFLGGNNNADDRLAQTVALPAGQTLTLRFWWQAFTEETDPPWDKLDIEIAPAGGAGVNLWRITDGDAGRGWQPATFDVSAYAGQTVALSFWARTDPDRPTNFYLDDISVEACNIAAPTVTPTATIAATGTVTLTPPATATPTGTLEPTPSATPSPSATATVTPNPTPTRGVGRIYLPLTLR